MKKVLLVWNIVLTQSYSGSFYDIHNVASNDTLNMRTSNHYSARKIGEIPHNGQCVEMVFDAYKWAIVRYDHTYGWVKKKYLKANDHHGQCHHLLSSADNITVYDRYDHQYQIVGMAVDETHNLLATIDEKALLIIRTLDAKKIVHKTKLPTTGRLQFSPGGNYLSVITYAQETQANITLFALPNFNKITSLDFNTHLYDKNILGFKHGYLEKNIGDIRIIEGEKNHKPMQRIYYKNRLIFNDNHYSIMDGTWLVSYLSSRSSVLFVHRLQHTSIYEVSIPDGKIIWHTSYDGTASGVTGLSGPAMLLNKKTKRLYTLGTIEYPDEKVNVWDMTTYAFVQRGLLSRFKNLPFIYAYAQCVTSNPDGRACQRSTNLPKSLRTDDLENTYAETYGDWVIGNNFSINGFTVTYDGVAVKFLDSKGTLIARMLADDRNTFGENSGIVLLNDGYFNSEAYAPLSLSKGLKPLEFSQFYAQFYRPDLVKLRLDGQEQAYQERIGSTDIHTLLQDGLPPRVEILTPSHVAKKASIDLKLKVCDQGSGYDKLLLSLNGRKIDVTQSDRAIRRTQQPSNETCKVLTRSLTLPAGKNVIGFQAFNAHRIASNTASIQIATPASSRKPDLHILAVAVDKYRDGSLRLHHSRDDADALMKSLQAHAGSLFGQVHTHTLYDTNVTKEGLLRKLASLSQHPDDLFVLFVAGHGVTESQSGDYFFLPVDFRYTHAKAITQQGISKEDFTQALSSIKAGKVLLLFDTCNSGGLIETTSRGMLEKTAVNRLIHATGSATIVASSKDQVALEGYKGHGVFTYALMEALNRAETYGHDNILTINELATYIESRVPELTYEKWEYEQIPQRDLRGNNFAVGER